MTDRWPAVPTGRRRQPVPRAGDDEGRTALGSGRSLSDLLDRVVDSGVVVSGDVVIGLAGVDLIRLDLRLLLIGAQGAIEAGAGAQLRPYPRPRRGDQSHPGQVVEGVVVDEADSRSTGLGRPDAEAGP
ncbi:MAG: gas vesicle protein [Frankia sp.]|nr:gas vesicle protein [Frankia sp.]